MDKAINYMLMVLFIMEIIRKDINLEKASINGAMDKFIKASGSKARNMVVDFGRIKIRNLLILDNGKKE